MDSAPLQSETKLPRRDWIVLPLLSFLTLVLLAGATELASRRYYYGPSQSIESCFVVNDAKTTLRGLAGCRVQESSREAGMIDYQLNAQGYRNDADLMPRQSGVYRIVMIGSSFALAYGVNNADSLASLLPVEVARKTGRRIELYNEGMWNGFTHSTDLRFTDALSAQPNMVLWILTQHDVMESTKALPPDAVAMSHRTLREKLQDTLQKFSGSRSLTYIFSETATKFIARTGTAHVFQYFVNRSPTEFVKSYLAGVDQENGFLKAHPSEFWTNNLKQVDEDAKDMEERAAKAGVPFVAVYLPIHAQADMLSIGQWPQGYDPYWLDDQLRTIVTSHGGIYLDFLPEFRNLPGTDEDYLPVDGHPNAAGDALLAHLIAQQLTGGQIPALKAIGQVSQIQKAGK